jgi:hypothetical protein
VPSKDRSPRRRLPSLPGARTQRTSLVRHDDIRGYLTELHRGSRAQAGDGPLAIRAILFAQGPRAGCVELAAGGAMAIAMLRGGADVVLTGPSGACCVQRVGCFERLFVPRAWSCAVLFAAADAACLILASEGVRGFDGEAVRTRRGAIAGLEIRRVAATLTGGALVRQVYAVGRGRPFAFAQVNAVGNVRGATRGFDDEGCAKYAGVLEGSAIARVVDLRPHSPTRGATEEIVLHGREFVHVPAGCATSFQAQRRNTEYVLGLEAELEAGRRHPRLGLYALGRSPS